jgi:hypothetical protein
MQFEIAGTVFKTQFGRAFAVTDLPIGDAIGIGSADYFHAKL